MPTPTEIVAGLTAVANEQVAAAIVWHIVLALAVGGMFLGWTPARKTAGLLLSVLPVSVSGWALAYGNPFNATAFGLLAMVLAWSTLARPAVGPVPAAAWFGGSLVAFGWLYPHFLEAKPLMAYLVAAPTGVVPCPTLAVLIGFTLVRPAWFSRIWATTLAAYGLFYGVFGALRLGVWLDLALIAGAAGLVRATWTPRALGHHLTIK